MFYELVSLPTAFIAHDRVSNIQPIPYLNTKYKLPFTSNPLEPYLNSISGNNLGSLPGLCLIYYFEFFLVLIDYS